ncbi:MAG: glycoside hydrolase family 19 protein [Neisseria sp.]|uniref:glycoside hydrolase family 19 protein n=1 Tax=Neisseria sp. TaxID=192066 RepID=UPI0026DCC121|nr:glycoside hydrolase family 19 protein [Neisseria sp.]MDO4641823.1 glycoside hydrolase family 19 protein [Neisseria sp.]
MELNERQEAMVRAAINEGFSPKETANFIAQLSYESHQLEKLDESFIYKSQNAVENIQKKTPSVLRKGKEAFEDARQEALNGHPEKLAELMYGGRIGNNEEGDGWKYHGRGYIQLTGKDNYRDVGNRIKEDLLGNPDLAKSPEVAAKIAVDYWKHNVPNSHKEDVREATRSVNGEVGKDFVDREHFFEELQKILTPDYLEKLKNNDHKNHEASNKLEPLSPQVQNLYIAAKEHLENYYQRNNLPYEKEGLENSAMALAALGYVKGMNDTPLFNVKDGQFLIGERNPGLITASMDVDKAISTPVEESINRIQQVAQEEQNRQIAQNHSPEMGRS